MVHQMLKALLVNNLTFIILFFCNSIYGQERINGKFCRDFKFSDISNCFLFEENGKFTHSIDSDLGNEYYGEGLYKLVENTLYLNYEALDLAKNSSYTSKYWYNFSDLVEVKVNVVDEKNQPIIGANMFNLKNKKGCETDSNGNCKILFKKSDNYLELNISSLGYKRLKIDINSKYNHSVNVILTEKKSYGVPIINQIDTLRINKDNPVFIYKEKSKKWIKID
jgi:hypothetical protein